MDASDYVDVHSQATVTAALRGTAWLQDWMGLTQNGQIVSIGQYDDYGGWEQASTGRRYSSCTHHQVTPELCHTLVIPMHRCCAQILKQQGIKLSFARIWAALLKQGMKCSYGLSALKPYGGIAKYHQQEFLLDACIQDKCQWMLKDPTTNKRNALRITKLWVNNCCACPYVRC